MWATHTLQYFFKRFHVENEFDGSCWTFRTHEIARSASCFQTQVHVDKANVSNMYTERCTVFVWILHNVAQQAIKNSNNIETYWTVISTTAK